VYMMRAIDLDERCKRIYYPCIAIVQLES
jgi:hypothetical protein